MERLAETVNDINEYNAPAIDGGHIILWLIGGLISISVFIGACFGIVICGCCISGLYCINKFWLESDTSSSDPDSTYRDTSEELKEVTMDIDTCGKALDMDANDV